MKFMLTVQNYDKIIELILKDKDWCEAAFGLQTVTKYNVTRFFCQLLATKILFNVSVNMVIQAQQMV